MQPKRGRFDKIALALVGGAALVAGGAYLLTGEQRYADRREIVSTLSAPALWTELATAFRDSTQSALWPHALEVLRSDGLAEGATVHAAYLTPVGESHQAYTIGEFVDGQGFTYATGPEHPLRGGGRALVMPTRGGAKLIWSVDYTWRGLSPAALFVRFYFVPRFFRELESNLRVLETK
jgi:hypothetical protein